MNYKYSFERKKISIQFDYVVGDLKKQSLPKTINTKM